MDAVILAGGKGARLDGVMPPYWKPLMPINGLPLICKIYDQVAAQGNVDNIFVVVAPENALQVSQVMNGRHPYMLVQRGAGGPGHALRLALDLAKANRVLVLMGDNLMPDDDVSDCAQAGDSHPFVIGTGLVDTSAEAARFTRIYNDGDIIEEGPNVSWPGRPPFKVWCGPLVLPVVGAMQALEMGDDTTEWKIGTHLTYIREKPLLLACSAVDIGTPDAVMEATS